MGCMQRPGLLQAPHLKTGHGAFSTLAAGGLGVGAASALRRVHLDPGQFCALFL